MVSSSLDIFNDILLSLWDAWNKAWKENKNN